MSTLFAIWFGLVVAAAIAAYVAMLAYMMWGVCFRKGNEKADAETIRVNRVKRRSDDLRKYYEEAGI